nr:AAA family ATPase [Ramlibacter albus]
MDRRYPSLLSRVLSSGPLPVPEFMQLALKLAGTLAAVHGRGVLHLHINPDHIVFDGRDCCVMLVGFEDATTFAQKQPAFTHHREIRGNLAYLAPEQTGRTGRTVDQRSDLYGLGATLYQAATGRPPFESDDPLQLLRDILARVPPEPSQVRGELPADVCRIIMRLLEKEPERRYQSAEGLANDLERTRDNLARGELAPIQLGAQDYPVRLSAPAGLVGRQVETAALRRALHDAIEGTPGVLLVGGEPGVGKTSLLNELRPMVTALRGWYIGGKFDQFRHDTVSAPAQAFAALGRLLLAEPREELAAERKRILDALGPNAGLMCNTPEFALLLGPQPDVITVDGASAQDRLLTTAVSLLRAVASAKRPLVVVLDDLQWSGTLSIRFIEAVLDAQDLTGLLLVGAYRNSEIDATHPLATMLSRRRAQGPAPIEMQLSNLPPEDQEQMVAEMMRLPRDRAGALARAVGRHTAGNPYDTVELLSALRRDGILRTGPAGWAWDAARLRRHVGHGSVLDLIARRIEGLPSPSRHLLEAMACLGGDIRRGLLCAATATSPIDLEEQLLAPLEDGLLVVDPGEDGALRMRHDRVQQAIFGTMQQDRRRALHLGMARRLAAIPNYSGVAVQQYLPALDDVDDPGECRQVARSLHASALRFRSAANFEVAQRLLAAGRSLLARAGPLDAADAELQTRMEVDHHVVLCNLGLYEQADAVYVLLARRQAPVEGWIDAACAQVSSLHNRSRVHDAIRLGLDLLDRIGLAVPQDFDAAQLRQRLGDLGRWVQGIELGRDTRPYAGDRQATAAGRLIVRVAYASYYVDTRMLGWLMLQAQDLWVRCGPSPELARALAPLGGVCVLNGDYRAGYDGTRHVLGVCESRGWESSACEVRYLLAVHASQWFEPLERTLQPLRLARESMLRDGELQNACFTYRTTTAVMLECSATLQECAQEARAGLAFARRLRHEYIDLMMSIELQLLEDLAGQPPAQGADASGGASRLRQTDLPAVDFSLRFTGALRAALRGDWAQLEVQSTAAMEHVQVLTTYRVAVARALHALSLAQRLRHAQAGERGQLLAALDAAGDWLARRSADAPGNFRHLLTWVEAERAWATGDFRLAAASYDAAIRAVEVLGRPWHHALITERAALFYLESGVISSGRHFMRRACQLYRAWGAEGKVRQLQQAHGFLGAVSSAATDLARHEPGAASIDAIDTLAILRASQALSLETSLARLRLRVSEVMGALTGATAVGFALLDTGIDNWVLFDVDGADEKRVPVEEAAARGLVPLSAFRYCVRTRQPVLVDDATADDRFARDPYFAGVARCALLVVPIMKQGSLCAVLLLENRLSRGAFTIARLEAVSMIAGQLAVSLGNAVLYDRLEQQVRDQTRELIDAARRAGMAQIATNVLHNVGNVLNSVNVSAQVARTIVSHSRSARMTEIAGWLEDHAGDLGHFLSSDDRGRLLPQYFGELARALALEREELLQELDRLRASVDHIKNVVEMQQSYAGSRGLLETVDLAALVDDALRLQNVSSASGGVTVKRDYGPVELLELDKTRIMQVLLVENARDAMKAIQKVDGERVLTIQVRQEQDRVWVKVSDNGCGIRPEDLPRIFSHGFTTKSSGHGFGLHSCAIAAMEMGGSLTVHSDGPGSGATFALQLPVRGVASAGGPAS